MFTPLVIENLLWIPIEDSQISTPTVPFTMDEIKESVFSFDSNKAPGLDGFTIDFFKKIWNTFKLNILEVFQDIFKNGVVNQNMNETYISLIAKKEKCRMATDFRPISLTTSLYKILSTVLSNRLKLLLPSTISSQQMTFVNGRQITDAILVTNKTIDYWKIKKTHGLIFKLDIKKAFDKINWNFIDFILKKKQFPDKWREWIHACILSVQYSILINGKPRGKIIPNRGIRQGDPLSPLIFVLAMDYLSRILQHL